MKRPTSTARFSAPSSSSSPRTVKRIITRSASKNRSRIAQTIAACLIIATTIPFYIKLLPASFRDIGITMEGLLPLHLSSTYSSSSSSSFGEYPNTVVTAYFSIRSKYKTSEYAKWMSTMLSLQDAMVIFCSPDMYSTIRSLRSFALNRTMIVTMNIEDLPLAQKYSLQQWQDQYEQDPERRRHASYHLFWIWLSKSYFVTRAIQSNPFHSQYFMWSDIGCFRSKRDTSQWKNKTMMLHAKQVIPDNRMLFLAHHEPNPPSTLWWTAKLKEKQHFYHSGTMMAGKIDTWQQFHSAFLFTLDGFIQRHLFVGDDQTVLQCTCLQYPHLCLYITHLKGDNHYFGLRSVLHKGTDTPDSYFQTWTPPSVLDNQQESKSGSSETSSRMLVVATNRSMNNAMVIPIDTETTLFPYNLTSIILPSPLVHRSEVTVVTAYFQLPSKFDVSKYDKWMKYMLSLQDAMVIFTSADLVDKMMMHRAHAISRTVVIPMELSHVPLAQKYPTEFWQNQLAIDPERDIHRSYQLFWIWLSKSWWVNQAIEHNYFGSDIFVWSDIGCFRNSKYQKRMMVQHPELIPRHSILQMAHHAPNPPSDLFWNDKYDQRSNFYHSGSQAAGYAYTWKLLHMYFMETVQGFLKRSMFIGEDQVVLQSTCRQHPTLCAYVNHTDVVPKDNHYFGLRYVLYLGGNYTYWYHPPLTPEEQLQLAAK